MYEQAVEKGTPTKGTLRDRNYYSPVMRARAFKADQSVEREEAVRLYSTQYGSAWEFQVRCPLGVGSFGLRGGKDFVIAGASLNVEQMKALRDSISAMLKDCGEESRSELESTKPVDYERCFDAAFEALTKLESVRFMWNGPIHQAATLLREAVGPQER